MTIETVTGIKRGGAEAIKLPLTKDNLYPEASDEFVATPYIEEITDRALTYIEAGFPIHFAGPAGTGKTTLAFHVAAKLGQPVTLVHGNDEFGSSDLVGRDAGYRKSRLVDNFIHSVVKTEEEMRSLWVDNRLTTACRSGDTLIYDEFNRSRPEANNVLLSVLAEGVLNLPAMRSAGESYIEVHPDFHGIFTSNPEEYAGTHKMQDALLDRMITLQLDHPDRDTEVEIIVSKAAIARADAERIVDIVRELRGGHDNKTRPTIRAAIAIARILATRGSSAFRNDPFFHRICYDVLAMDTARVLHGGVSMHREMVDKVIRKVCRSSRKTARAGCKPKSV